MERREWLALLAGTAVLPLIPEGVQAALDPAIGHNGAARSFRIGYSGFAFGNAVEEGVAMTGRYGFRGLEPFRQHVMQYLDTPQRFGDLLGTAGLSLITCSNGGQGMTTNFIDPAQSSATIESHFTFARDFIRPLGATIFKINVGSRPAEGPTDAQLVTMAQTLNELGRRTADVGIRLAPHPHIWGPLERPEEIARVRELTDPDLVGFTIDTAHFTLGGNDPVAFIRDHFDRVAHIHLKDTPLRYRGHTGPTPAREEHQANNLYPPMGAGGVDLVGTVRLLNERDFNGWITVDYDPPRPIEGTLDQQLTHNKFYVTEFLGLTI
jgi:inosose dehydratase